MSVGWWRRAVGICAAIGVTLTAAACSGSQQAAGTDHPATAGPPSSSTTAPTVAPVTVAPLGPAGQPAIQGGQQSAPVETSPPTTVEPTSSSPVRLAPSAAVTAEPALGSTDVAPAERITLSVQGGTLSWVSFVNPEGKAVKGTIATDRKSWTLSERLGFDKVYTVTGFAVNPDGVQTKIDGRYRTAATIEPVTTSISPGDGAVVGVAAPVIVRFGLNPQDKALIERNVKIVTQPEVEGSWAWITHNGDKYPSLDWRPKKYWPAGTKVHVESNVYGLKFADKWYGGDDVTVDFTIGRNQVVIADAKAHRMTVKRDGKVWATYDASFGMGDNPGSKYGLDPDLVTRSGIHVVMSKHPVYKMSNPAYGYTDAKEYWAVRISNNGEFIHNNPGTTSWQLANVNKTHGCINLSWDNAKAYFETAIYGDPVEVVGTSVQLSRADGDIYDWAIPWSTWTTLSALSENTVIT